jgi:hypothetical protein
VGLAPLLALRLPLLSCLCCHVLQQCQHAGLFRTWLRKRPAFCS